jgi:hypothetical protein
MGARRAWHGLILLLLATLILTDAHGIPSLRLQVHSGTVPPPRDSRPYLSTVGPAPLRFAAIPEPPQPAPPGPVSTPPAPAAAPAGEAAAIEPALTPASPSQPGPAPATETPLESPAVPAKEPARILIDDVRPAVRPEEFLPYFQVPGGKQPGELTVIVPVPSPAPPSAPLPPSSATYTQTPK